MSIIKGAAITFFIAGAAALALCMWANYNRKDLLHIIADIDYEIVNTCGAYYFFAPINTTNCSIEYTNCYYGRPSLTCNGEQMRCFGYDPYKSKTLGYCIPVSSLSSGYVICRNDKNDISCENIVNINKEAIWIGCTLAAACLLTGLAFCCANFGFSILMNVVTACCGITLIIIFSIYFVYEVLAASIVVLGAAIFGFFSILSGWDEYYERTTTAAYKREYDDGENKGVFVFVGVLREGFTIEREVNILPLIILFIFMMYTVAPFLACNVLMCVFNNYGDVYRTTPSSLIVILIHTYCWFAFMFIVIVFKIIWPCELRICIIFGYFILYLLGLGAVGCGVIGLPIGFFSDLSSKLPEMSASFVICAIQGSIISFCLLLLILYCCYKCGCFERVRS